MAAGGIVDRERRFVRTRHRQTQAAVPRAEAPATYAADQKIVARQCARPVALAGRPITVTHLDGGVVQEDVSPGFARRLN